MMVDSSRQVLPDALRHSSAKIVFANDGSFVLSDVPGLFYFPARHNTRLESGAGRWELLSRGGRQQVQLNFQSIASWKESDLPYGTQLEVSKDLSGLTIYYFLGDADEGRKIAFERNR